MILRRLRNATCPRHAPAPMRMPVDTVRFEPWHRRLIYAVFGAMFATGVLWLLFHTFVRISTPFGDGPHGLESWWLKLHGLAAMMGLLVLGSLIFTHVRYAWKARRNIASGIVLLTSNIVLVATGYALYYFGGEQTRPMISLIHWGVGVALVLVMVAHIVMGHRVRGG